MKSKLFGLVGLLLFSFGVYANDYLIVVDNLTEQAKKDFYVIAYVKNHYLVIANDNDLAQMNTRNFSYDILDNDPQTKEYYLVYPTFNSMSTLVNKQDAQVLAKYGRVVKMFEKCFLMEASIDNLNQVKEFYLELNYINQDKYIFKTEVDPEVMAIHKRPVKKNKYIEDMIKHFEETGTDSADKCMRECVGFRNRFAEYKYMRDEVNPWLRAKFEAYGCDSIMEHKVSGCAPVISGVWYGKKNPGLMNGFVSLMGGHTDNTVRGKNEETRHQGAWDGGSQTVAYMEPARLLSRYEFENTVVFSPFTGEERGLLGAKALLRNWQNAGVKTICGWNFDMNGWGESVRLSTGSAAGSKDLADKMRELYQTYDLKRFVKLSYDEGPSPEELGERGTDLMAYNQYGYMALQFMGSAPGCQIHTKSDTINDRYSAENLANTTIIGAVTMMEYAVPIGSTMNENTVSYINNHNFSIQTINDKILIRYTSEDQVPLSLTIYNPIGKIVATITPEKVSHNNFTANWQYNTFAEGTYILKCKTNKGTLSEKVMVLK